VTENQFSVVLLTAFLSIFLIYTLRNAIGQRGVIFRWVKSMGWCTVLFLVVLVVQAWLGFHGWWTQLVALSVPMFWLSSQAQKRSRWIPTATRRKVIELFERKTGAKYDPRVHHIDHKVPFAKGGGHTLENLRVVDHRINRKKAGKMPDWFRIWTGRE